MKNRHTKLTDFGTALIALNSRASGLLMLVFVLGLVMLQLLSNLLYDMLKRDVVIFSQPALIIMFAAGLLVIAAYKLFDLHLKGLQVSAVISDENTIESYAGLIWVLSPQQIEAPLMAIHHHQSKLTHVWVILVENDQSTETTFESLCQRIAGAGYFVKVEAVYIAQHDVKSTYDGIMTIMKELVPAVHLKPEDVVVDVTGGLRPMAAGVVVACAFHNYAMQYLASTRDAYGNVIEGTQRVGRVDIDSQISWSQQEQAIASSDANFGQIVSD